MLSKKDLLLVLRESGNIERCHNFPHHGSYSVGLHSYNVVSLILVLHPDPSVRLIKAAMWHDSPERYLGDLPAPAKWYNPNLHKEYQLAEDKVLDRMGIYGLMTSLDATELSWLKGADRLELLFWCREQHTMGNHNVLNVYNKLMEWYEDKKDELPEEIREYFEVATYHLPRTEEII